MPSHLIKSFELELRDEQDRSVQVIAVDSNFKRLIKIPLDKDYHKVTLKNVQAWGGSCHLYSFDII